MDNNTPQSQVTPPVQTESPPLAAKRGIPKFLIALIAIVLLIVIGTVGYLVFRNSIGKNVKPYVFTIDSVSIPQEEVSAAYGYYFSKASGGKFDRNATLENIKDIYLENYLLKKELEAKGVSMSSLTSQIASTPVPSSLQDAPESLKKVIIENTAMQQTFVRDSLVRVRSGELFIARYKPETTTAQIEQLEPIINTRLTAYKNQIDGGQAVTQVMASYKNDSTLKGQSMVLIDAVTFENVYESQPPLQGQEYLDAVFLTPQSRTSEIFKSGNGVQTMYGFVYPTTPVPENKYKDFRSWFAEKKQSVKVTTEFSSI